MKLRVAQRFSLYALTAGASLTLGLLSFGGMFALLPILPIAIAAFFLATLFDGEIYKQNIWGALVKLFQRDNVKQHIARQFLSKEILEASIHKQEGTPQFFKDYDLIKNKLHALTHHKHLSDTEKKRRDDLQHQLETMEAWFTHLLFNINTASKSSEENIEEGTLYQQAVVRFLKTHIQNNDDATPWHHKAKIRQRLRIGSGIFSVLGGIFMGLGTLFLLTEPLTTIPFLLAIPFLTSPYILIPLALLAAVAYALLTFNALCDFFENETYKKWANEIKKGFSKETRSPKTIFLAVSAIFLIGLALFLTICTAGTWFTIAQKVEPIFNWLTKLPTFIMSIINPIITGLTAVAFHIQNTTTTLSIIKHELEAEESIATLCKRFIRTAIQRLIDTENILQWLNPFRLILKLTLVPLQILLFLGHLVSLAVTADRLPGISEILCIIFNIISEGFEDLHYFLPERPGAHHDDHNHDDNIPNWILKRIFLPIFILAAFWHAVASYYSRTAPTPFRVAFQEAWQGVWQGKSGHEDCGHDHEHDEKVALSSEWTKQYALVSLDNFQQDHLASAYGGSEKLQHFQEIRTEINTTNDYVGVIARAKEDVIFQQHRFFGHGATKTTEFFADLDRQLICANE